MDSGTVAHDERGANVAAFVGPTGGVPWGFLGALLILLLVELALRASDPRDVIKYELGEQEHHAIAAIIQALPPADVYFVGSSHTREGILAGEVRRQCKRAGIGGVKVLNYGLPGARADGVEALVNRLVEQERKPGVILLGLSARDLRCRKPDWERLAIFWRFPDWWRHYTDNPGVVGPLLPQVVRNEVSRYCRTLSYRESLRTRLAQWPLSPAATPCPVFGDELSAWHQQKRSLKQRSIPDGRITEYLAHNRLDDSRWSARDRLMLAALSRLIERCRYAGVPLVLFEMPMSEVLRAHTADGLMASFHETVMEIARREGVKFVTLEELSIQLDDGAFHDHSHLNYEGARKLSTALSERVVIPLLSAEPSKRNVKPPRDRS